MVISLFELVIDTWGMRLGKNINSGTILSFDAVCLGSPVILPFLSVIPNQT